MTRSNLGSFAMGSSLWAESALLVVVFLSGSSLGRLSLFVLGASPDCVSYIECSTLSFGFSSTVTGHLARCRRSSTKVNYSAKWSVYRAWCARHGLFVSRPSVPKVASFLLYLRRSLSLSLPLRSLRTAICSVLFFASSSLSSLPTLFSVISSALFVWSVLFLLVVFLPGIFLLCFLFFGVLPLSLCPPDLLGTFPIRSSFCSPWRPLAGLRGFRLSCHRFPPQVLSCFSFSCLNFGR